MTDFEVRCYHKNSQENVIGAEVVIYDDDDVIDNIVLVDKTKIDELSEKLDNLDSTYVDTDELLDYLANTSEETPINATSLAGFTSDKFLKVADKNSYNFNPSPHASTSSTYGAGTTTEFGHVKLLDNLSRENYRDGEALSSHQGYALDERITELENKINKSSLRVLIGRYSSKDEDSSVNGEYGTRIQVPSTGDGIYARILCDHPDFDYTKLNLFIDFNNTQYEFNNNQSADNRKLYLQSDGSVISGRLGVNQQSGTNYNVYAFVRHSGDIVYPATTIKRVEVL